MASPFDHPELIPPRPDVGIHTGPPPEINDDDYSDYACRVCRQKKVHSAECGLAISEGRVGEHGPDYVRGMDCLPADNPVAIKRAAEVAEARERAEEWDRRRAEHCGPTRIKRVQDAILERAASLISGEREQQYGSAIDNFTKVGKLWAVTFGLDKPISPVLVAIAMTQLKEVRLMNDPNHEDSWPDAAGYLGLGGEIAAELRNRLIADSQL